jgi:hypothetical protein
VSEYKFAFQITSEGLAKQNAMRNIPRAHKKILTDWLTGVARLAKRNAGAMQKSWRKTGHLANNIGIDVQGSDDTFWGLVGTGVKGAKSVKYARIQDKGGTITAKGKYLAIPFKGVTERPRDVSDTFVAKSKGGCLIIFQRLGKGKIKPMFALKRSVNIPAANWFTNAIDTNKPLLDEMMKPENTFRYALANFGGK